jgi:two-component system nitrate/nitrite response regulator NarL
MDHIRIMLADDHQLVRKAFALMLDAQPGMEITGHAGNGKELLELIKAKQPNVILLDVDMPVMSGRQCLGIIKLRFPDIKVIMLSLHKDAALMNECMGNGASAYLHKDVDMEDLIAAIRSVHTEGVYFNKELSKALLAGVRKEKSSHPFFDEQALSEKELVVLKELCEGKTNRDIAGTLHISIHTVGFHRNNIYTKAKCNNIASLMKYAIRNGLVSI